MMQYAVLLAGVASLSCVVATTPLTVQYVGIARDFSQLHNDFEGMAGSDGPQMGQLLNSLNSNGQTVYNPPALRNSTAITNYHCYGSVTKNSNATMANWGQFFWDEHYQDVPGVNIAFPVTMTMTKNLTADASGNTYTITDDYYHPVNNVGYGPREGLQLYAANGNTACCEVLAATTLANVTNANMWFTVQYSIPFFYRNTGETFSFLGDDDLYVFINGRLVSGCDLGGIHSKAPCSFALASVVDTNGTAFNLLPNTQNTMTIFYAERHTAGSHLQITTSILPTNTAPVAYNTLVTVPKASSASFTPRATDADGNNLQFLFTSLPVNGVLTVYNSVTQTTINATANTFYNLTEVTPTYTPIGLFVGQETFAFIPSDFIANGTAANITVTVTPRDLPPAGANITASVYSNVVNYIALSATDPDQVNTGLFQYAVSGTSACSLAACTLPCVRSLDSNGAGTGDCIPGLIAAANATQATFLKYVPVNLGVDSLDYIVFDGTLWSPNAATVAVTVSCDPLQTSCTSAGDTSGADPRGSNTKLSGATLAGVITGAAVLATLLGGGVAYAVYFKVAAGRFEKAWERDWAQAQISENPMYKSNVKEAFNPLYVESNT